MGDAYIMQMAEKVHTGFWMENLRIKWPLGISVRNERIILDGIIKILDGRWWGEWITFIWLG